MTEKFNRSDRYREMEREISRLREALTVTEYDLEKTKRERDKLLPFVLVRCPKCREFMMPEGNQLWGLEE